MSAHYVTFLFGWLSCALTVWIFIEATGGL